VLTDVTLSNPTGGPSKPVQSHDVEDLYQTGRPFSAKGLQKLFTQINDRFGEIGYPKFKMKGRGIDMREAVGFGGQVRLTIRDLM
jgi:outer membrane protein assembly factor BamA